VPKKENKVNEDQGRHLEKILDKYKLNLVYKRTAVNKESHGVDEVSTNKLLTYLKKMWLKSNSLYCKGNIASIQSEG